MTSDKKIYYKISIPYHFRYECIFPTFEAMSASLYFALDGAPKGAKFQIEVVEMTEEEFEDLGEFEGW